MPTTTSVRSDLHYEVRGSGPAVLFIAGASGDAGHFANAAERLADEFTAVSYDRRGCSRSARLHDGEVMSIAAQADDAAALIEELGLPPAIVFGTSGGGDIALELVARRPELVRGAIVHEPALVAVAGEAEAGDVELQPIVDLAAVDPRRAMEAFVRGHTSDATFEALDPELRERILRNGAHFFSRELAAFRGYVPDTERIRANHVPLRVLASQDGAPQLIRATARFAQQHGLAVEPISGHHAPYLQQPEAFAEELRPILRQLSRMAAQHVNGIRLYCEEHGSGASILCIHGAGGTALAWADAIDDLARLGRVIAYDRRGCARSERPRPYERTGVAEHADDAAALLDALAAAPAIVVGRSYGGTVATDLALRYPDRVRALVLLEPDAPRELAPTVAAWVDALAGRIRQVAARDGIDAVAQALICEVAGKDAWHSFPDQIRQMLTGNGAAILAELGGEWWLQADAASLATIQQPALLVAAADSPPAFHEPIDALAHALPHARTALVGGGHLIDPAAPEVIAFIEEVLERQQRPHGHGFRHGSRNSMSEVVAHEMQRAAVNGVELEYELRGSGEPVVLIHWGVCAAWGEPLMNEPALADRYRLVGYHRAGFAGSDRIEGPVSMADHAAHCALLMRHLGIERAHVVGHSSSADIALQLALDFPDSVHTLALLEPARPVPPTDEQAEFVRDAVAPAVQRYRAGDTAGAVDTWARGVFGSDYRGPLELGLPGAFEQAVADADAFFAQELPALQQWSFTQEDARRITQATLAILGANTAPTFRERLQLLISWLPNVEAFELPDATHLLHLENPRGMADALASFYARHPLTASTA